MTISRFLLAAVLLNPSLIWGQQAPPAVAAESHLLARQYHEGETLSYHMKATNQRSGKTLAYEIQGDGVVKKNSDGFYEEFAWSNLIVDGHAVPLPVASQGLRQMLSLEPTRNIQMPDLSKVHPMMIGPITDMLTFYGDMLIAKTQGKLTRAGDHFYFKHGTPNSWADGTYVTLGQDSIDFDVTLTEVDHGAKSATVVVRHVPPPQPQIKIPAEWMRPPVADTANNWVEVSQAGPGKFSAQVGKETFVATIKLNLADGRIVSATLYNPVEVLARECSDPALTACGEPARFQILRQIEISSR